MFIISLILVTIIGSGQVLAKSANAEVSTSTKGLQTENEIFTEEEDPVDLEGDDDSPLNTEMALKFMSLTKNAIHELDTNGGQHFHSTIPMRVCECLKRYSVLRCAKHFALQKMKERPIWPSTGNLTKDFLDQFFDSNDKIGSLVSEQYRRMSERELNKRLMSNFKKFFQNRDIKFQLLPSVAVKIVSSPENKFQFTLSKKQILSGKNNTFESSRHSTSHHGQGKELVDLLRDSALDVSNSASYIDSDIEESLEDDQPLEGTFKKGSGGGGGGGAALAGAAAGAAAGGGTKQKKNRNRMTLIKAAVLRMAVPAMFMPFIMLGTFLPFLLPVLKIATLVSILLNNAAFIAALIYAARTQMSSQDEHQVNYNYNGFSGYH